VRALCCLCSSVRLALVGGCVIGPYVPEPMMRTGRSFVLAVSAAAMVAVMELAMLSRAVGSGVNLQLLIRALVVLIGPFSSHSHVLFAARLPLPAPHALPSAHVRAHACRLTFSPHPASNKHLEHVPDRPWRCAPSGYYPRGAPCSAATLARLPHTHQDGIGPGSLSALLPLRRARPRNM
jgi:hypothetical protein